MKATVMKKLGLLKSRKEWKRLTQGMTSEQIARLKESMSQGEEVTLATITEIQAEQRETLRSQGIDYSNKTPEIGKDIQWNDVLSMAFQVKDFDRNGTTVDLDRGAESVKAKSRFQPYGYLIVESPTLNQPVRLPIVHNNDFWLAASVFDDPNVFEHIASNQRELLVTYQPKKTLRDGRNGSMHHCLHFALVPVGTLEKYYADNSRMARPKPELIFGKFVYDGLISVGLKSGLDGENITEANVDAHRISLSRYDQLLNTLNQVKHGTADSKLKYDISKKLIVNAGLDSIEKVDLLSQLEEVYREEV